MSLVRVNAVSTSVDGFVAGPDQDQEHPLGIGGGALHEWIFATVTGQAMIGNQGGETGIDDDLLIAASNGVGATIMGRNMFGPVRGAWGEDEWRGWWGDEPPFHHPVFVLTNYPRAPLDMEGGTTFQFVTDGPEAALALAREAAGDADIRLGGGARTIRQFIERRLVDSMHFAVVPVLLGSGERVFDATLVPRGYRCSSFVASTRVAHFTIVRT